METMAELLAQAITFEQMAAAETDAELKAHLLAHAAASRKMAAERAMSAELTLPKPTT